MKHEDVAMSRNMQASRSTKNDSIHHRRQAGKDNAVSFAGAFDLRILRFIRHDAKRMS
jgi:hypothetical protein